MSWIFFSARLGSAQSALGSIRLGEPDCAFVGDGLALALAESATLKVDVAAADIAALSLPETAASYTSPLVFDTLALAFAESLSVEVNVSVADTVSLAAAEDGAGFQDAAFFTGRLGWQRSQLSFVRLGSPDAAYVWPSLAVGLGENGAPSISIPAADTLAIALGEIAHQSETTAPGPVLVDQAAAEIVFAGSPNALLDQAALETVFAPLNPAALLDQLAREAIYAGLPSALLDQLTLELILKRSRGTAYVSGSTPSTITSFVY